MQLSLFSLRCSQLSGGSRLGRTPHWQVCSQFWGGVGALHPAPTVLGVPQAPWAAPSAPGSVPAPSSWQVESWQAWA